MKTDPQKEVDNWNAKHPIGTKVLRYKHMDFREPAPIETKTISAAWVLSGHTAVIQIENKTGCVALRSVIPL